MAGDYLFYKSQHHAIDQDAVVAAGATGTVTVKNANYRIWVQTISIAITTHATGKKITIQDTAGTPIVLDVCNDLTAAAGVPDRYVVDFGAEGFALTLGKNLSLISDASGPAFTYHVDGYQRLDNVIAYDAANQ